MSDQFLKLWNDLKPVSKEHTKSFKRAGGFSGTDVSPVWRIRRMTEVFGPVGKGWGYDIIATWSEMNCAYVRLGCWYVLEGERYQTGEQIGGTSFDRTPDEAYKMSVTDAIGKCLVNLGLAADVYMGQHDKEFIERIRARDRTKILALIVSTHTDMAAFLRVFKVASLSELTAADGDRGLRMLKRKAEEMGCG